MFIIHQWNKPTNKKSYKSPIVHFRIVIHQNHAYINIIKYNFLIQPHPTKQTHKWIHKETIETTPPRKNPGVITLNAINKICNRMSYNILKWIWLRP